MGNSTGKWIGITIGLVVLFAILGACYPLIVTSVETLNDSGMPFADVLAGGLLGILIGGAVIYGVVRMLGFGGK